MPRGGRRYGTPGRAYSNRTDLNGPKPVPARAASGQTYGKRSEQMAAQRAMPISRPSTDAVPSAPTGAGPAPPAPTGPRPGGVVPLDAPSQRPNEPLTAGLPVGPGPGPEALGDLAGLGGDVNMQLRAIFSRYPNEDLRRVLEMIDTDDGSGLS
jgi:hypothetical protein